MGGRIGHLCRVRLNAIINGETSEAPVVLCGK
jgi:hypothetical protein